MFYKLSPEIWTIKVGGDHLVPHAFWSWMFLMLQGWDETDAEWIKFQ